MNYIKRFNKLKNKDKKTVGGKNASLGEMFNELSSKGIRVPDGFATTADAYWEFLEQAELKSSIEEQLKKLDKENFSNLKKIGENIREMIMNAKVNKAFAEAIKKSYQELKEREEELNSVAVRSSATAEDLPEASFAGQHDSFMNISGEDEVVKAVQRCIASLFTDRAIKYREDNDFEHMKVALSAGVQKMVRSDKACAGVAFTIEPDSGFDKVIFINGSWGLGDNVVGGEVNADRYYVYKENLKADKKAIISKELGEKEKTMVYVDEGSDESETKTKNEDTPEEKRNTFILSDDEVTQLAKWCLKIEEHYEKPMDIEWAKDGVSNEMYIVQARPETVHSRNKEKSKWLNYKFKESGNVITTGSAIGKKIASGKARLLNSPSESVKLEEGEILVTANTDPDWDPILRKSGGIVTNKGGRTSHAAIVARELGVVAVVGTGDATDKIEDGQEITVSCIEGSEGKIYEGELEWEEEEIDLDKFESPDTMAMLIIGNPRQAFEYAPYPVDGVGLTRLEFTIANSIKVHPMALIKFDELKDEKAKEDIEKLTKAYNTKESYFTEKLSMAVGTIASSFYPRQVIVRMSDFKSNEYANLLGGKQFEPEEENPMLGYRGASRYYSNRYKEGFRLECEAMKIVREDMGLDNVTLMVPFCRTVEEGKKVIKVMAEYGLKQGENGLEIYMMVEIPSNVSGLSEFAKVFDGFSIGSNDLTQLVLGVDRDSSLISDIFDERNEQVKDAIATAIKKARQADKPIGLCGQAPSDFPDFAGFLVENKIASISFIPDALSKGLKNMLKAEAEKT